MTPPTVARWIEDGKLPSFTTGGGHRRVWPRDLIVFLRKHNVPVPPELAAAGATRILVVDDDATVRRLIVRVITGAFPESEMHEAVDGFEAGQKIFALLPFLVVIDLRLPGLDGLKVCRIIRADERTRSARILAVSGHDPEGSRDQVLEAGGDDFLAKPFRTEELVGKVRALLAVAGGER
ncbi:MAG: response regulator [Elusimicrobia bacterium]|nr:response regulator [Elusimicrobiota bacterium]